MTFQRNHIPEPYRTAHSHSSGHRAEIQRSHRCACFWCLSIFEPRQISQWHHAGETAICPQCGIDAVLGDASGYPLTDDFLVGMKNAWFNSRKRKGTP